MKTIYKNRKKVKERTNELNHQNHVGGFLLYDFEILNGTKEKKMVMIEINGCVPFVFV